MTSSFFARFQIQAFLWNQLRPPNSMLDILYAMNHLTDIWMTVLKFQRMAILLSDTAHAIYVTFFQ